jgi:hypothetical protein
MPGVADEEAGKIVADELGNFVALWLASSADSQGIVVLDVPKLSKLSGCAPSAVQALRRLCAAGMVEARGTGQAWINVAAVASGVHSPLSP